MQQPPKVEVVPPAKPQRLKVTTEQLAGKKQLQFESPLPGRARAMPAMETRTTMRKAAAARRATTTTTTVTTTNMRTITDAETPRNANGVDVTIKTRLAEGCTSLMYACQHGDIVHVLAQMRAKVGAT
ncbi:GH24250 [Drosophila grimshawi]|uniref:GH24250 n=1 Tax=Drosophila grimshawi TaxID=7222 RepID=B4JTE6_DROGR|nr:GH24250 [Drosophila grimshawi]